MPATHILLTLLGAIALLMWGIHMVTAGVQRAFGSNLRRSISRSLGNRVAAFAAGFGVTALLQSSTATALMVSSFASLGVVDLVPGLAVMLGANVGTTVIVQAVSLDVGPLYPALLLAGVLLTRQGRSGTTRDVGQAVIGLGLLLLALTLLVDTVAPVQNSATLRVLMHALVREPVLALLAAAAVAWAAHSSVAAVLLVASMAAGGLLTPAVTVMMVIGCNLGSAVNPLLDALGRAAAQRRVPLGNLLNRVAGTAIALPLANPIADALGRLGDTPQRLAADAHLAFNLGMAVLSIGLLTPLAALLRWVLPDRPVAADPGASLYLDTAALSTPAVALANASREVLRMADIVEQMLGGSRLSFHRDDRERIAAVQALDDGLDRLFVSIQGYLGSLALDRLSPAEERRIAAIHALAINLEHVGDIVEKNLMEMAAKRIRKGDRLPQDALDSIVDLHDRLLVHLRLAVAVYLSGDTDAARRLVSEKEQFRQVEQEATRRHLEFIRTCRADAIPSSAMQLDITRDLKRIESHLAATAHAILEQSGDLRPTRLLAEPP